MIDRFRFLAEELVHRLQRPARRREYGARTEPFLFVNPDGIRFHLYPNEAVDGYIAVEGIYERRFLRFVRSILSPGAVMIDIGANIGNHALYLHDLCSRIDCFEPNPVAADRLQANIDLNHAENIMVHRFGLGGRNERLRFCSNVSGNLGNSGFFKPSLAGDDRYEAIELPIRNADEAIAELRHDRVDLLKIDVEGLEEEILRALRATIERFRPLVAFEFHGHLAPPEAFPSIRDSLPDYLIGEVHYADEDAGAVRLGMSVLRHGALPRLRQVGDPEPRTYENLLAVPTGHTLYRSN